MPEGETARGLARKARDRGHKLSDATAKVYLRGGPHGTPSIERRVLAQEPLSANCPRP